MNEWSKRVYTDPRSKAPSLEDPAVQLSILLWARAEGPRATAPQPMDARRGALPAHRLDFGRFSGMTVMEVARQAPWFLSWVAGMRAATVRLARSGI